MNGYIAALESSGIASLAYPLVGAAPRGALALSPLQTLAVVAAMTCVLGWVVWWSLSFKDVTLIDDWIHITSRGQRAVVPVAHLKAIDRGTGRPPAATLRFRPPTKFGATVRMLVPHTSRLFRHTEHPVVAALERIVENNLRADRAATVARRAASPGVRRAVDELSSKGDADLGLLSDEDLEELIDRLPLDSPHRDVAWAEQRRRWYG